MSEMSVSLQKAPAAFAPRAAVWEENASISHAVIHSLIYSRCCRDPQERILQVPVPRLAVICRDETAEGWGAPAQRASQVVEKAEEERCMSSKRDTFNQ